jgi:hypothetical protein
VLVSLETSTAHGGAPAPPQKKLSSRVAGGAVLKVRTEARKGSEAKSPAKPSSVKMIWAEEITLIKPPIGEYRDQFSLHSFTLIFNIITTNRKRTAIAPTCIVMNITARNSIFDEMSKPVALQNTSVRNATGWVGFFGTITIVADIGAILANKSNKNI